MEKMMIKMKTRLVMKSKADLVVVLSTKMYSKVAAKNESESVSSATPLL